jgi:hypothetical protein
MYSISTRSSMLTTRPLTLVPSKFNPCARFLWVQSPPYVPSPGAQIQRTNIFNNKKMPIKQGFTRR